MRKSRWYYGWNIVAVCILSQVCANGLTYNAFSLFLHGWSAEMQVPISHLQLSMVVYTSGTALASPFVGMLADRYPARILFACGLVGVTAFYFAISTVVASWQIIALYGVLIPLPLCMATGIVTNAVISRWFIHRRGLAFGLSAFGVGMAGLLLPPLIAAMLPVVGWRVIWRIGGVVLALLVLPLVTSVVRNRPTEREGLQYVTLQGDSQPDTGHARGGKSVGWREIIGNKNFWCVVGAYLPFLALRIGFSQNLAPYAASHGLSQESAGILISVSASAQLISSFALGPVSDRFGNRLPFVGLAVIAAIGAVVLALGSGVSLITLGCALLGLVGGLHTLMAAALASEFGSGGFGKAYGLSYLFMPVLSFVPYVVAKVQETSGSYTPALLGLGMLVMVGGGISLLLDERRVVQA